METQFKLYNDKLAQREKTIQDNEVKIHEGN